jgi:uncharacterized protein YaaR (DUF327 family)
MANHTTGAQRYNKRADAIWDHAKILGQQRYQEDADRIKELTDEINKKAQKFTQTPQLHFDDLLHVIEKLKEINQFLKP